MQKRIPTELRATTSLLPAESESDLYIKLELTNPTGTHKDRAAERVVERARDRGFKCVTTGSCGNYGIALARCCALSNLECHVFLPSQYESDRWRGINQHGGHVFSVDGTYEDAVMQSQDHAVRTNSYDANPLGEAGEIALKAYAVIASEILEQLHNPPASVWVPVGNGTTLGGMFRGFLKGGALPRLGAVGSSGNTSATASARLGRMTELDPISLRESTSNQPLVNWRSLHATLVIQAIQQSNGFVYDASDDEMITAARILLEGERITVSPAAAATFAAFRHNLPLVGDSSGAHVLLLTSTT